MVKVCTAKLVAVLVILAGTAGIGAAQQAAPNAPLTAAGQNAAQVDPYVVGTASPPAVEGAQVRNLTLEDAMLIALENNLGLQVARLNPELQDYALQQTRAAYLPSVSGSYSYNNSSRLSEDANQGVGRLVTASQSFNSRLQQTMPWYGGSLSATWNNSRGTTNATNSTFNPNIRSSVQFSYSQPLLQGFLIDNTRNSLRTQQITRQITDITLLQTVESTKTSVRNAYWALRSAIEQIEIQRRSLAMSQRQLEENRIRVEIGTMAPIDIAQPEASVATAEQSLLNAEISWRNAELNLKRLLVSGREDPLYTMVINPVDLPTFTEQTVDIPAAVDTALGERTDLQTARRNLDISGMNLEVSKNSTLPSLSMSANYSLEGTGGNRYSVDRQTNTRTLISSSGWSDALSALAGLDTPQWSLSFNFSYPIGTTSQRANYARAQIQREQETLRLAESELNVATQVTNAGLAVENTAKQLQAAQKSREVAERNLEAELTRFNVGMSNNFQVAQLQNSLTSARLNELNRLIAYINALAEFERVQRFPN